MKACVQAWRACGAPFEKLLPNDEMMLWQGPRTSHQLVERQTIWNNLKLCFISKFKSFKILCKHFDIQIGNILTSKLETFWRPNWKHLDVQIGNIWMSKLETFWRPIWKHFDVQYGNILTSKLQTFWRPNCKHFDKKN